MKRKLLLLAAAVTLLASCASHYVVTDEVGRHLDGTRTVLVSDSTSLSETPYGRWQRTALDKGQVFDFRGERDTMRYAYSQMLSRDGWTVVDDSLPRMMRPHVTVSKHFRWFTTRYYYTAVFPGFDSLPVPVLQYLTDEEQQLLFQPLDSPADWNGADMYALLDKLNTQYIKWWRHCFFEKEFEAWCSLLDSAQSALLAQYHDTLLALVRDNLPDERFTSLKSMANLFPELVPVMDYQTGQHVDAIVMAWYESYIDFDDRVLWRVQLPDGTLKEHMVSSERLIQGDYTIEETGRTVNWWACILTLLLLTAAVWFILRGVPCGAGRSLS